MNINNVYEPYLYVIKNNNSNETLDFRIDLIRSFNQWTKISDDDIKKIEKIILKIHSSFLLLDGTTFNNYIVDIEDNSKLRNGFPV
jgi:hypothetical protein